MWAQNLPDTPPGRLEWMMNGNPAGPSRWFFAFDRRADQLAGMISVMPKLLVYQDNVIRAGIMGDLVVAKKYRVFGPALSLVKAVISSMENFDLAFIYTIPNPDSEALIRRAGFRVIGDLLHLVKPIDVKYYFERYQKGMTAALPQSLLKLGVKLISRDTYVSAAGVKELAQVGGEFPWSGEITASAKTSISAYRTPAYLKWRFFDNPLSKFRMITVNNAQDTDLKGYLIFTLVEGRIHIYDIYCIDRSVGLKLIKGITRIAERENCVGIYIRLIEHNPLLNMLEKCRFIDTKDTACILVYSKRYVDLSDWDFFSGDRNI